MTPVQGLLERTSLKSHSKVMLRVLKTVRKKQAQEAVREYVLKGSEVYTDALRSYNGLNDEYNHQVIDDAEKYVDGKIHTNGLENFWSLLKRCVKGTYVSVEPFHLFRYLDEEAFRFNERKDNDAGRFMKGAQEMLRKGIRYADLTGKTEKAIMPS